MSSKQEHPIQAMGFWVFGFLSVVLAVLKLTVAGYWSWWRVMLPFLAFLGHNAVYLLAGFLCFCWLKQEEDEEEPTTVQKHSREGYNLAALLFFFLFLDNLLRRVEGQAWKGFWLCSGRLEVVVLFEIFDHRHAPTPPRRPRPAEQTHAPASSRPSHPTTARRGRA